MGLGDVKSRNIKTCNGGKGSAGHRQWRNKERCRPGAHNTTANANFSSRHPRHPGMSQRSTREVYLAQLQFYLNHRRPERSDRPERVGKIPAELLTGQTHSHWLRCSARRASPAAERVA
jgi:hypothetical protein